MWDSWWADGLVRRAWERLDPPTRDELERRTGIRGTTLAGYNTGRSRRREDGTPSGRRLSMSAATKIIEAVPGLTLADLGAPAAVLSETEPTVLDRLRSAEAECARAQSTIERILAALISAGIELPAGEADRRSDATAPHDRPRQNGH